MLNAYIRNWTTKLTQVMELTLLCWVCLTSFYSSSQRKRDDIAFCWGYHSDILRTVGKDGWGNCCSQGPVLEHLKDGPCCKEPCWNSICEKLTQDLSGKDSIPWEQWDHEGTAESKCYGLDHKPHSLFPCITWEEETEEVEWGKKGIFNFLFDLRALVC